MHQFISGTFDDADKANKTVDDIMALNYPCERITIIMSAQTRNRFWSRPTPSLRRENKNATSGGNLKKPCGDRIGAIINADESGFDTIARVGIAGATSGVFVAGPAAAALAKEGAPSYTPAGVVRTLARLGMLRFDAERLERDIDSGGIIVGVITSNGDRAFLQRIMQRNAARNTLESLTT